MTSAIDLDPGAAGARAGEKPFSGPDQDQHSEQRRIADLEQRVEDLGVALNSRDVIGQAKGILIAHYAIGADDAFSLLVRLSQNSNIKLRDAAAELVDHVRGHGPAAAEHCARVSTSIDRILERHRSRTEPPASDPARAVVGSTR